MGKVDAKHSLREGPPHENAAQGINGDYPEIFFAFLRHVVEGLMGVTPRRSGPDLDNTVPASGGHRLRDS